MILQPKSLYLYEKKTPIVVTCHGLIMDDLLFLVFSPSNYMHDLGLLKTT